jgi:transcriptional regulator with XRE-family HTH domain
MKRPGTYSTLTLEAARLLGDKVRLGRKHRGWTMGELAERVGASHPTIRKIEIGDPSVALGTAFEAAVLVGVPLFDEDTARREAESDRVAAQLAVLPVSVRRGRVDDDF